MEIIRNDDGSLTVPVAATRVRDTDDGDTTTKEGSRGADAATAADGADAADEAERVALSEATMVLRPGEGGYSDALAQWDVQQHPDRAEAVSTVTGREQAMAVVHAVAEDPAHVTEAVDALDDPEAGAEALRHVLVGGTPSIQAFASEVAEAEGGEALPAHTATKVIGEVLAEIDSHTE
jgi:hypothetical protein